MFKISIEEYIKQKNNNTLNKKRKYQLEIEEVKIVDPQIYAKPKYTLLVVFLITIIGMIFGTNIYIVKQDVLKSEQKEINKKNYINAAKAIISGAIYGKKEIYNDYYGSNSFDNALEEIFNENSLFYQKVLTNILNQDDFDIDSASFIEYDNIVFNSVVVNVKTYSLNIEKDEKPTSGFKILEYINQNNSQIEKSGIKKITLNFSKELDQNGKLKIQGNLNSVIENIIEKIIEVN